MEKLHVIKNGKKCVMTSKEFYAEKEGKSNDSVKLDMDWYNESHGYISLDEFIKNHPVK